MGTKAAVILPLFGALLFLNLAAPASAGADHPSPMMPDRQEEIIKAIPRCGDHRAVQCDKREQAAAAALDHGHH